MLNSFNPPNIRFILKTFLEMLISLILISELKGKLILIYIINPQPHVIIYITEVVTLNTQKKI